MTKKERIERRSFRITKILFSVFCFLFSVWFDWINTKFSSALAFFHSFHFVSVCVRVWERERERTCSLPRRHEERWERHRRFSWILILQWVAAGKKIENPPVWCRRGRPRTRRGHPQGRPPCWSVNGKKGQKRNGPSSIQPSTARGKRGTPAGSWRSSPPCSRGRRRRLRTPPPRRRGPRPTPSSRGSKARSARCGSPRSGARRTV